MAIEQLNDIADLDVNTGTIHSYTQIKYTTPSFDMDPATWWLKDNGRMHNEAFKFWLRMDDADACNYKIMIGCDSGGSGLAVQLDFSVNNRWIRLVNTSGIDQAYDSVIAEVDIKSKSRFSDATFIPMKIVIANGKFQFWYGTYKAIDIITFTPTGTHWGVCNLTGSTKIYVGDMYWIYDQVLWGNVNLNGEPDMNGNVVVYNQATYDVITRQECDSDGNYMVFIDDDPVNLNKYFIYGWIPGIGYVQPRGVSNITI